MSHVFHCIGCGHCCHGAGGIIVNDSDLHRLCSSLNCQPNAFIEQYGEVRNNKLYIRVNEKNDCIFFQKRLGCQIHTVKPDICKAWPFFRGNLIDKESLELAKGYCPGIRQDTGISEFAVEGMRYLTKHNLIGSQENHSARALLVTDLLGA